MAQTVGITRDSPLSGQQRASLEIPEANETKQSGFLSGGHENILLQGPFLNLWPQVFCELMPAGSPGETASETLEAGDPGAVLTS